nr:MAG TPA: hypothetical protein [Bacteriophage sp.]
MTPNVRESLQYGTAIGMVVSGIILAFLSFFLNGYNISDGVLWYISQALVYSGAIFGVNIYFKTKLGNFESRVDDKIEEIVKKVKEEK